MFVITLFQPATKAISRYPDDLWVKIIYIVVLLFTYGLTVLVFVLTKRGERKNQKYAEAAMEIFRNAGDNLGDYKDIEWDRVLRITYSVDKPGTIMDKAIEQLPEEYMSLVNELKRDNQNSYQISVASTVIIALSIALSVLGMMISPLMCYGFLIAGIVLMMIVKRIIKKRD